MSAAETVYLPTFKNEHLSVSRLKKYEACAFSFFCGYVDKAPGGVPRELEPRGTAADAGVAIHSALEAAYAWIIKEEHVGMFPDVLLYEAYQRAWQSMPSLTGATLFQEGLDMLRTYVRSHAFVDHTRILANEKEFNITIDEFPVNGYIDLIEVIGPNAIRVVDFKSNRMLFTQAELADDLQAAMYLHVARILYPWAKTIVFEWAMLRHDTVQSFPRTPESVADAMRYVVMLGRRIESDTEWKATLNVNCSYCDHRRGCETYRRALAGNHEYTKAADLTDIGTVVAEREALHKVAKAAYARKSNLEDVIRARLVHDGEFEAGGYAVRGIPAFDTDYPLAEPVIRHLVASGMSPEEARERVCPVNKVALDGVIAERVAELTDLGLRAKGIILKSTLEGIAQRTPKAQRLDIRAVKVAPKENAEVGKKRGRVAT